MSISFHQPTYVRIISPDAFSASSSRVHLTALISNGSLSLDKEYLVLGTIEGEGQEYFLIADDKDRITRLNHDWFVLGAPAEGVVYSRPAARRAYDEQLEEAKVRKFAVIDGVDSKGHAIVKVKKIKNNKIVEEKAEISTVSPDAIALAESAKKGNVAPATHDVHDENMDEFD